MPDTIGIDSRQDALSRAFDSALGFLAQRVTDPDFSTTVRVAFGGDAERKAIADFLHDALVDRDGLHVKSIASETLGGARAAYEAKTGTIYVSEELIAASAASPNALQRVLLEEIGHAIDARLNAANAGGDAAGDEGAIFAALILGENLSEAALAALRAENDRGTIVVHGQAAAVEFAAAYGTVTLDGSAADWTAADRLEVPGSGTAGYELYGKFSGDAFVFALKSATAVIGVNTTFWLNTDQNTATGYKIWGFAGGAEYNVNFDGALPKLYTGDAGQTLVNAALDHAASADGKFVEFAVPVSMLAGAPKAADVLVDVNDSVFLPNDYSSYVYTVAAPVVTPPPPPVTGDITINGDLSDWTAASRLELPGSGVAGYELYGKLVGDNYVFALKADAGQIGAGTTFWLNTDQNSATGYQIWDFAGGAEYNVNFTSKPNLYTGAEGQTLVNGNLAHAFNAGHNIVEFAVPVSQLAGAPKAIDVLVDVNDEVYLPTDYSLYSYTVAAPQPPAPPPPPASDPSHKVAIVYSESTAANFYDLTSYSQLFMSAQYQAIMAGVPFDVLSESDLTNVANLANYKAILFPAFSHVAVDKVAAIEAALTSASKNYGVGLIAGGDFMTNNATGGVLSGDPYARMKSLLGVYRAGEGTGTVEVHAHDTTHSAMDGYQANELIRTYDNIGFSYFNGVGAASVLVDQQVGGQTYNAVLATTTGGNNVHFASDGLIADNNLLWQAIDWAVKGTGPEIGLQMSRQSSITASRTDMDQSQETHDVSPDSGPGIYDKLLPILTEWKAAYNFVGSYYINVGNNSPDQITDWSVSKPYYQQLLALGNEIGTHSYTHPEDTNPLTASQIEFEFNQSQKVIEQQLGIDVVGAAVPGAPEKLATSQAIIQYFDYLTGGFSSVGSGYPGAFGYLTPGDASSIYIAPNVEFDFSLVEFRNLTPAQAQAEWAREWAEITSHADVPVVVWPWHDYGAASWMVDPPAQSPYTKAMFTNFIAAAAAAGTEFVTLADLAQRMESFEKTKITYTTSGSVVTANVTGTDVGKFALDLDGGQTIKSVNDWYAYDNDSVFLPKNGGQFAINLGATPDDVTHIVALPSRGELLSVTGNGTNLNFSVKGDGKVIVDLKAPAGQTVVVTGAQIVSLVGDQLELALANAGQNDVSISFAPSGNFPPVITSNGGADTASVSIAENGLTVTTVKATAQGGGTVHYAIDGGADANAFTIDANSGALKFKTAPDFETPADAGQDNVYNLLVKAIDGAGLIDTQSLSVRVTDVAGVTLTGNSRANTLNGAGENDTLSGLGGNDTLNGLAGNDTLLGGAGADTLIGGLGNDRLDGGAGNDLLTGGAGVDVMIGGAGNDRFIFGSASDIGTIAAHDVITDFVLGQDRLDLSALDANGTVSGNQAFQFLAQQGAAFTAPGQVHFVHDTAKNVTYVEGNMDAVLTADFRIELNGILQLKQADFVL